MYGTLCLISLVFRLVLRWLIIPGLIVWVVDPVTMPKKIVLGLIVIWLANRNTTTEVVWTFPEKKSDDNPIKPDHPDPYEYSIKR